MELVFLSASMSSKHELCVVPRDGRRREALSNESGSLFFQTRIGSWSTFDKIAVNISTFKLFSPPYL